MGCELCGRGSCTRSFHSIEEQNTFDETADSVKERQKSQILTTVNRVKGWYDENDNYVVKLEDVLTAIENV